MNKGHHEESVSNENEKRKRAEKRLLRQIESKKK